MYLIVNETELKQLKKLLSDYEYKPELIEEDLQTYEILTTLVRRFGRLEESIPKERFYQILERPEFEYLRGMSIWWQWVGYREFLLHKQLSPALSGVFQLEWDLMTLKELTCFLNTFYDIKEIEDAYYVKVKSFLSHLPEGEFESLKQDWSAVWSDASKTNHFH